MKTEVIMRRHLFGKEIRQKSKSNFFSATDLVNAGNRWRIINNFSQFNLSTWLKNKSTKEFIAELECKYEKVLSKGRGRNVGTWMHPLLFIDLALAISPKLKIEAYEWLFDLLIENRNKSGDSYKEMCGYLYAHHNNKRNFQEYAAKVAKRIKLKCHVTDWNDANEKQLALRNKIHNDISLLADVLHNNDEAVRIALLKNR